MYKVLTPESRVEWFCTNLGRQGQHFNVRFQSSGICEISVGLLPIFVLSFEIFFLCQILNSSRGSSEFYC